MITVIDNYDSFTYNLVQLIGELGAEPRVHRNDAITPSGILAESPRGLIISPGPCSPSEAGISMAAVSELGGKLPILGVCLGHQSLGAALGGRIARTTPLHGKSSMVWHDESPLFEGVPNPFRAGRYHSLIVERDGLPAALRVAAWTEDGIVMALRHEAQPTFGVQFHPESILTLDGRRLLQNFLRLAGEVPA